MMIHFGEPQVFERQMAQPLHGRVHVHRSRAHLRQQRSQLILIHVSSARVYQREASQTSSIP